MLGSQPLHRRVLVLTAVVAAFGALSLPVPSHVEAETGETASDTVTIEMVDFAFEPSEVTVGRGDVVRFVQAKSSPHNVEFTETPDGTELGDEYVVPVDEIGTRAAPYPPPRMGPYLTEKGETYEFVVTDAFAAGEYRYICTPHEALGMKGRLIVERPLEQAASGGE